MSRNKYTENQSNKLEIQGLINKYHSYPPCKDPFPERAYMYGRYLRISKEECKKRKPYPIKKLQARFQKSNKLDYHQKRLNLAAWLNYVRENDLEYAIREVDRFGKLPDKIHTQLHYLKTELNSLDKLLKISVPDWFSGAVEAKHYYDQEEAMIKLLKSKP